MNQLFYGDNLQILRERFATESIDLVYLDPPFNSQASYNVLFKAHTGEQLQAQIEAFEDTWHWNDHAESAFGQRRQPTQDGRPLRRYRRRWRVERLFALASSLPSLGDPLGVSRRELLRHGPPRLYANPVQVFMRPLLVL